jgi:hypothetical protein
LFFDDRYKVLQATWRDDPEDRPTFTQLASIMGDFLEENVKQVQFIGEQLKINILNVKQIQVIGEQLKTNISNVKQLQVIGEQLKTNISNVKQLQVIRGHLKANISNVKQVQVIRGQLKTNISKIFYMLLASCMKIASILVQYASY